MHCKSFYAAGAEFFQQGFGQLVVGLGDDFTGFFVDDVARAIRN
jgi:hypothetical protein